MKNGLFKVDWGTFADAIVTAVAFAVVAALYQIVTTTGFSVFSADWGTIGRSMVNIGFVTAVVSIGQDFLSTKSGSVLNITPPATIEPTV